MKTNQKSFSTLSVKAIEAMARKAAAQAASSKPQNSIQKFGKPRRRKLPSLDRQINSVFESLKAVASDNEVVKLERLYNKVSCQAFIKIFDLKDVLEDEKNASPKTCYALYPSTYNNTILGSVAIYSDDAYSMKEVLQRRGSFFGYAIKSVTVEYGRRPFVDVNLVV